MSNDPNDLSYLTPGHLLVGGSLTSIPQEDVTHLPLNRLSRWQRVNQIHQHFCRRWSKEYLNQLQQRNKWHQSKGLQVAVGNMVLLQENESIPLKWSNSRVEDVHPGIDGSVSVATVKTTKGVFKRPTSKLCILPLESDE